MLYNVESIRKLEKAALELGVSGDEMMQRAGVEAYKEMIAEWPQANNILLLCGCGNNGGDGFVLAEHAYAEGLKVKVLLLGDERSVKNEALTALQSLKAVGVEIVAGEIDEVENYDADLIVDALLGIGLHGEPKTDIAEMIDFINTQDIPVLAMDVPSGLNADTGHVNSVAMIADMTVTFIAEKQGMYTADGPDFCGDIVMKNLELPSEIYADIEPDVEVWTNDHLAEVLSPRVKNTNKSDYGHVLVVGGHAGMSGAAMLAGLGALRVGAGLVTVATHPDHAATMNMSQPELMCHAIARAEDLHPLFERATCIVIGPGLSRDGWGEEIFAAVMEQDVPIVIDADGLYWLDECEIEKRDNWVLTPHPGEAARLIHFETDEIQENRFAAIKKINEVYGGTVLLKGCGSLVFYDAVPLLCPFGNPGMASGGMGDLLAGMIAGLIAQGAASSEAAGLGVYLHALAGDQVAKERGERGMLASDLLPYIQNIMKVV